MEDETLPGNGGADQTGAPIERLVPGSPLHTDVLNRLQKFISLSRREMTKFHTRWQSAELQYQAYISTKQMDELKRAANKQGTAPELVTLTVPYTYASVQTVVTYLLHTFCGRKPIWQVGAYRDDNVRLGENIETVLQYNGDHEQVVRKLYQFFLDGEKYGLQVMRILWKTESRRQTRMQQAGSPLGLLNLGPQMQRMQNTVTTFEGNDIFNIDPYDFFPDPRVPMETVGKKGEFVFWRTTEGRFKLKKAQAEGLLANVDKIQNRSNNPNTGLSERGRLANGGDSPRLAAVNGDENSVELYQGTVELIPSEWGLGDSDSYEKWLFSIANDNTIIQAEPLDLDHDQHPVIVGEPYSEGYGFGNVGMTDMLLQMQEMMSWMLNSHIFNVRSILNNTLVVNPQMIDMEDLKRPGPGKVIKMKPAAFGQNPSNAVYQVPMQDVTRSHINDLQVLTRFADLVSSTNDNLRGIQSAGGRKTATEVRTAGESGASRLASHARLQSAQSISPMGEMMAINLQQNMTEAVYLRLLGNNAMEGPLRIGPEDISGDFYFPVHDGTLPLDRVALLDVWREIFMAIITNPGLAQIFDAVGIFEYIAELGGAKNLSTFKVQTASNEAVAAAVQAGNMVPGNEVAGQLPPGVVPGPGRVNRG